MPLKCIRNGNQIFAFNYANDDAWKALRNENADTNDLRMECCNSKVVLRTSPLGTRHFAHSRLGECTTAPETAEHLLAKDTVAKAAIRAGWQVAVEQRGNTANGELWIADVLATNAKGKSVAFEVQWSRQTIDETKFRQGRYDSAGIRAMWLFRQSDFLTNKAIPAFRLRLNEDPKVFEVLIPSPRYSTWIKPADRDQPHHWQQRIPLPKFVEGVLARRLKFAPSLNLTVPLEVLAARSSCWKCHKPTRIVTGLRFVLSAVLPGSPDFSTSVWQIGEQVENGQELLEDLLPIRILREHGIGKIRRAYSKTLRREYSANTCINCGIMQGQFYEHEIAIDEESVFTRQIFFDESWVKQLGESNSYVYRWWFDNTL
jgi:hypothetical protein